MVVVINKSIEGEPAEKHVHVLGICSSCDYENYIVLIALTSGEAKCCEKCNHVLNREDMVEVQ